jgi:hypothetical protein
MSSYPDVQMQSVLDHIRRYSNESKHSETSLASSSTSEHLNSTNSEYTNIPISYNGNRPKSPMVASAISRRQSNDILMSDVAARRLSEAGVNRRPSAALVLTEDTDSFRIGDSVYVDGIKPGRIQFIGKLRFCCLTFYFSKIFTNKFPLFFFFAIQ